jgi:DNA-directed RNA polymerase specialized sigma subunit
MIVGEIKRYLRDGNSLRVSRSIRDMAYRVLKAREEIEGRDEEATIEKIAQELQVAQREVVYALDAISDPVSLYEPVYNKSGDTLLLMDQLADVKNTDEILLIAVTTLIHTNMLSIFVQRNILRFQSHPIQIGLFTLCLSYLLMAMVVEVEIMMAQIWSL